jgi:hypothetical protein
VIKVTNGSLGAADFSEMILVSRWVEVKVIRLAIQTLDSFYRVG